MAARRFIEKMTVNYDSDGLVEGMEIVYRVVVPVDEMDGEFIERRLFENFSRDELGPGRINALENARGNIVAPALNSRRAWRRSQ